MSMPELTRLKALLERCYRSLKKSAEECERVYSEGIPDTVAERNEAVGNLQGSLGCLIQNIGYVQKYQARNDERLATCDAQEVQEITDFSVEMLDHIDSYCKVQKRMEERVLQLRSAGTNNEAPVPQTNGTELVEAIRALRTDATAGSVKLPKIDLPKFDGDEMQWFSFWELFEKSVHDNQSLSGSQKMQYLLSSLLGNAKNLVANLGISNTGYVNAIACLKMNYNRPDKLATSLQSKITHMPPVPDNTASMRAYYNEICSAIDTLISIVPGEDENKYTEMVLAKLPIAVTLQLGRSKGPGRWTMANLRRALLDEIKERELAECRFNQANAQTANFSGHNNDGPTLGGLAAPTRGYGRGYRGNRGGLPGSRATQPFNPSWNNQPSGRNGGRAGNRGRRGWNNQRQNTQRRGAGAGTQQRQRPQQQLSCLFCNGNHRNDYCREFFTVDQRKARIADRCHACLKRGHFQNECDTPPMPCSHCNQPDHHSALCFRHQRQRQRESSSAVQMSAPMMTIEYPASNADGTEAPAGNEQPEDCNDESNEPQQTSGLAQFHGLAGEGQVLLQTVKVKLANAKDTAKSVLVAGLLDCGSSGTYITDRIANQLQLNVRNTDEVIEVDRFMSGESVKVKVKRATLMLHRVDRTPLQIDVAVIPMITRKITKAPVESKTWTSVTHGLRLADTYPARGESVNLDILIGNDLYMELTTGERIRLQPGLFLLNTHFGWILSGRINADNRAKKTEVSMFVNALPSNGISKDTDGRMCLGMEAFWSLETLGINDNAKITEDDEAQEQFDQAVHRNKGRYVTCLPKRSNITNLPTNYGLALGRLGGLIKGLKRKPDLCAKYQQIIQEQLDAGIVEDAPKRPDGEFVHYIPHHPVEKPSSTTTKVRPVYDASARMNRQSLSLNDCLLRGPIDMKSLVGILLRFRTYKYGVTADVAKAFHQIQLHNEDRDLVRFIWVNDLTKPLTQDNIRILRFTRVPFGLKSSPYLLQATIVHHLDQQKSMKKLAEIVKRDIYVDNMVTGAQTEAELTKLYHASKKMFNDANMNLREWVTNSELTQAKMHPEDWGPMGEHRILGIIWHPQNDTIRGINVDFSNVKLHLVTKRMIFSIVSRVYDPNGFFAPITITARNLMKEACRTTKARSATYRLGWDDPIETISAAKVQEIVANLKDISTHVLPRYIGTPGEQTMYIAFCDASKTACATAIYMRMFKGDLPVTTLVYAKSHLANIEKVTMPRLELVAALMGIRALKFVKESIGIEKPCVLFTDSQIVLHWVRSAKPLPRFVQNRVNEIRKLPCTEFRYINTKENPADFGSRGAKLEELGSLWWNGPKWLNSDRKMWPTWDYDPDNSELAQTIASEQKHSKAPVLAVIRNEVPRPFRIDERKYSSYTKLLRVTAYCHRFIRQRLRGLKVSKSVEITADELADVRREWDLNVQQRAFADVFKALKEKKRNQLVRQQGLRIDENGILRCHGRLGKAELPLSSKFPVLLPSNDHYSHLVIKLCHEKRFHSGPSATLNEVRAFYWILQGRAAVKRTLARCNTCLHHTGGSYKLPVMPDLPEVRVSRQRPFTHVGVDYMGPLLVNERGQQVKVWVTLFTCLTVRAVHLEIADNLSAYEFSQAFRKFMGRRGPPTSVVSDNAPNFRLVAQFLSGEGRPEAGLTWHFIPAYAPWQGGVYERMIKTVKESLSKAVGRAKLSKTQLGTLLVEVEQVVNSRPITYLSSDSDDPTALTPASFLQSNAEPWCLFPDADTSDWSDPDYVCQPSTAKGLRTLWKRGEALLNEFWRLFTTDYILGLREKTRWYHKPEKGSSNKYPKLGSMVLVKEVHVPRCRWRYGLVTGERRSSDGHVRAVLVKTKNGVIERPINLLVPLEAEMFENDHQRQDLPNRPQLNGEDGASSNVEPHHMPEHNQIPTTKRSQSNGKDVASSNVELQPVPSDILIPKGQVGKHKRNGQGEMYIPHATKNHPAQRVNKEHQQRQLDDTTPQLEVRISTQPNVKNTTKQQEEHKLSTTAEDRSVRPPMREAAKKAIAQLRRDINESPGVSCLTNTKCVHGGNLAPSDIRASSAHFEEP